MLQYATEGSLDSNVGTKCGRCNKWWEAEAMALGETNGALRSAPQEHDVSAE